MTSRPTRDSSPEDAKFRELLAAADRHMIDPSESLVGRIQSVLSEALGSHRTFDNHEPHLKTTLESSQTMSPVISARTTFGGLRAWATACVAVACLAVVLITLSSSPEVLGDVFSALRSQPCVHIRCRDVNDKDLETWISAEHYSVKRPDSSFVFDRKKKTVDTYYPTKQRIVRSVPSFQHEPPAFDSLLQLLSSLPVTTDDVGGMKVVSILSEPDRGNAAAIRHSIELAAPRSHLNGTITISLDVVTQANTSLPSECSVRIRQSGRNAPLERTVNLVFDYPQEVPQSVHELGAPAEAKLVDTMNPESDPLFVKVQEALERGRRGLKSYRALAGTDPQAPQYAIWRSGQQWRIDYLGNFRDKRISGDPGLTPPQVDLSHWNDQFADQGQTLNLFDGIDRWDRNAGQLVKAALPPFAPKNIRKSEWIGSMTLERLAYPLLEVEDGFIMTMTEESPSGLVLVEYSAVATVDDLSHRTKRYWLNPEYGYAVVKWEYTDATGSEETFKATMGSRKHMVHLNSGYQQSPEGIWYPGAVREVGKQFFQTPESPVLIDDWMYYTVDFSASIPQTIFETP